MESEFKSVAQKQITKCPLLRCLVSFKKSPISFCLKTVGWTRDYFKVYFSSKSFIFVIKPLKCIENIIYLSPFSNKSIFLLNAVKGQFAMLFCFGNLRRVSMVSVASSSCFLCINLTIRLSKANNVSYLDVCPSGMHSHKGSKIWLWG